MTNTETKLKQVVIVGGGFGGLVAARSLASVEDLEVTLITDSPQFRYNPSLYRVATGYLRKQAIMQLSDVLPSNVRLVIDKVEKIDRKARSLTTAQSKVYHYDYAVLALGVVTSYFGIAGLDRYAFGIKSAKDLQELHDHLHEQLNNNNEMDKNYVVVGGGPTGVELAAGLMDYLKKISKRHKIKNHGIKLSIIEAAPRLLPTLKPRVSKLAAKRLDRLGVSVMTDSKVEAETATSLVVGGKSIPTKTVIWTAGVTNNPFYKANAEQFSLSQRGKVVVDNFLAVDEHTYVIGDNAETTFSGMAQTAVRQGRFVAKNIAKLVHGDSRQAYKNVTPAYVVPIGRNWAVMQWQTLILWGVTAGMFRRAADLIGYADVMGLGKALSLWMRTDQIQESCPECNPTVTSTSKA